MARRKDRRKSRAQIKNDTRSVLRAIGQMCNERGVASESHLMDLLHDYRADGKIEEAIKADRFSWLDFVLHTDCIVRRTNGKLVPIQAKSSRNSAQRFIEKHRNSCIKKFGALPVVVVMPPYGLYGQELEKAKRSILRDINAWRGDFQYEPWMLGYIQLLDLGCFRHLGHNILARIRMFQRQHPEYFATPTPPPA